MDNGNKLTKKEKKELRKLEWQEKAKLEQRNSMLKKYGVWAGVVIIILLLIAGLVMLVNSSSSSPASSLKIAAISARDMSRGDPKSKVTLVEYGDFQCPACGAYYPLIKQLLADKGDKLHFVYRFFPLVNLHPNAFAADQAAYAAYKQGKFWDMYDLLYQHQNDWVSLSDPTGTFMDYARQLKLNTKQFQTDLNSSQTKDYVNNGENEALSEGINATPTFFINGVQIQNPQSYGDLKKLIDGAFSQK